MNDDPKIHESTAYHEAGHGVAAFILKYPIRDMSLTPGDSKGNGDCEWGGRTVEGDLAVIFSGDIAETKFDGQPALHGDMCVAVCRAENHYKYWRQSKRPGSPPVGKLLHRSYELARFIIHRSSAGVGILAGELLRSLAMNGAEVERILSDAIDEREIKRCQRLLEDVRRSVHLAEKYRPER